MYFNNPAFLPIAYFYYFFIIFYIVLFCVSLNYLLQKEMIFATFVFSLPTSFVYGLSYYLYCTFVFTTEVFPDGWGQFWS